MLLHRPDYSFASKLVCTSKPPGFTGIVTRHYHARTYFIRQVAATTPALKFLFEAITILDFAKPVIKAYKSRHFRNAEN